MKTTVLSVAGMLIGAQASGTTFVCEADGKITSENMYADLKGLALVLDAENMMSWSDDL